MYSLQLLSAIYTNSFIPLMFRFHRISVLTDPRSFSRCMTNGIFNNLASSMIHTAVTERFSDSYIKLVRQSWDQLKVLRPKMC